MPSTRSSLIRLKGSQLAALTPEQITSYHENGFLIVPNAFTQAHVDKLLEHARVDPKLAADVKQNKNYDDEGIDTRLVYREGLSDDIYSAYAMSDRILGPAEAIYGEKMRHFYHLNMQKEPNTGGWQYHQDYGYHYKEFLYPKFISVMLALNPATKENGCLRVVPGSNKLGRLEHRQSGSQLITHETRLKHVLAEMDETYCELEPGDALFFEGNILHASGPNLSDSPRWSMIYAYVPASNTCVLDEIPKDLSKEPIDMLDDAGVDDMTTRHWDAIQAEIA